MVLRRRWLPYALAFNSHLLTDRMWRFPHTLFHPFFGRRFGDWRDLNSVKLLVDAYKEVVREDRLTIPLELGGVAILCYLLVRGKLYRPDRLLLFLRREPGLKRKRNESDRRGGQGAKAEDGAWRDHPAD
jgi:hypothetical protein